MPPGRAERVLWLADDACDLLMVKWKYGEAEPLPKLRIGQPVALRNARYGTSTRFLPPPGSEHLAPGGAIRLHMCEADALSSSFPAEVGAGGLPRAPHLKPHAARLAADATSLRESGHLPQLAALAAAVRMAELELHVHCTCTACAVHVHCMRTRVRCMRRVHGMCTACVLHVHCMCTARALCAHSCALHAHCACTACACALRVRCMCDACAMHVRCRS